MFRKPILFALAVCALFNALSFVPSAPANIASAAGCTTAPLKPTLALPRESSTVMARSVTLKWNQAACATTYDVVVKQGFGQGRRVDGATGMTTTKYTTRSLALGHRYTWRVKACNLYGCTKSSKSSFVSVLE